VNISRLLRQQIQWSPTSGTNVRGDRTYGPTTTVQGRAVPKVKDLIGREGEVVTTAYSVMLTFEPMIGDLLDGHEVIAVTELVDTKGVISGYTALTR